jgi:hypothetical protein
MPLPDHVETTSERSAAMKGRPWLRLRAGRACDDPRSVYAFTDGSTRGSYAAVLVQRGALLKEEARWRPPTPTRNVGAEWDGFVLGLELAPPKAKLTIVVDLLWIHAQLIDVRRTLDAEIVEKLERARALISKKTLELTLVHHDGHQTDDSDFTRWNARADELCDARAREHAAPKKKAPKRRAP